MKGCTAKHGPRNGAGAVAKRRLFLEAAGTLACAELDYRQAAYGLHWKTAYQHLFT